VAVATAYWIFWSLLFFAGDVGEVFDVGFASACWGVGSSCCVGTCAVVGSGRSISVGGSVNAGGSVDSSGLVGVRAAGFSCFYGVEGVSFIYILLCEGRGTISVPDGVLLVRVVGEAVNCGSTDRGADSRVGGARLFLPLPSMPRGQSMFIHCVRFTLAGGRGDGFWTSPKFGAAWLGGRWIRFLAVGLLRRRVMSPSMECAWGGRSTCVVFSVCSRVLVAKCRDVFVTVLCHLFNGFPSQKKYDIKNLAI
jgi:hypothetical protein